MQRSSSATPTALFFRQLFDRNSCTYTYLLADPAQRTAVLIDPVDTLIDRDLNLLFEHRLTLKYALNTHAHADHITATGLIKSRLPDVKSVIGKRSGARADVLVSDGDEIKFGNEFALKVIETPGHTEGCVSYHMEGSGEGGSGGMVFTGDALLVRGCGRTDFQGGSSATLFKSVREHIFSLPLDTIVYPAHDYRGMTCSTVGEEVEHNPRLCREKSLAEFVKIMENLKLSIPIMMDVAVPANLLCGIQP